MVDNVKELEERCENCIEAMHNTNISTCHDACITLKSVKTEVLPNLYFSVITIIVTDQCDSHASSKTCTSVQGQQLCWW